MQRQPNHAIPSAAWQGRTPSGHPGGSYGGLFGLYTLFHQPEVFQRYIIISPSISYDGYVALKYEAEYAKGHSDLAARVFMSAGGLEKSSDASDGILADVSELENRLRRRGYPNLFLETVVFEGETHHSGVAAALSRGMRSVYKPSTIDKRRHAL